VLAELNVIEGPYLKDIFEQPTALANTLRHLSEPSAELIEITRNALGGRYKRIILTGMGSSLFALYDLYLTLISQGCSVFLIETSELVHSLPGLVDDHALIVAVSQSGRSAELLRAS
jgi:glucosamine--fructose-6-phosphate aminotransferase (isomerizing)